MEGWTCCKVFRFVFLPEVPVVKHNVVLLELIADILTVTFKDHAKVLAVKAADNECGCKCGGFLMVCKAQNVKSKFGKRAFDLNSLSLV